jgi:hypothetical protein
MYGFVRLYVFCFYFANFLKAAAQMTENYSSHTVKVIRKSAEQRV